MAHSELKLNVNNNSDKEIEDVIDARKKIGQYDIYKKTAIPIISQNSLFRNAFSTPATGISEERKEYFTDEPSTWVSDGDLCNYSGEPGMFHVGPTDSEITVVRVKREGLQYKTDENKWTMHDDAIPGDGSHLGESPSLVNLVTLVGQSGNNKTYGCNEYLVPLSSWDPYDNPYQLPEIYSISESNKMRVHVIKPPHITVRRSSLAGKITNFLRKRCMRKSKTSVDLAPPESKTNEETEATSSRNT